MEALRFHQKVQNRQIVVQLPNYFVGEDVEIIVLSNQANTTKKEDTKHQDRQKAKQFFGILRTPKDLNDEDFYMQQL
jgi:hypothetical protein